MSPRPNENPNVIVRSRNRSIAAVPNCPAPQFLARLIFLRASLPRSLVSAILFLIYALLGYHWPTMVASSRVRVKQRICEGGWTAVECDSDHDKRRENWNQSLCGTEAGTDSNRQEGRQKSGAVVRDSAEGCSCIVQGRRPCIRPAITLPPEERALGVVPIRLDLGQVLGSDRRERDDQTDELHERYENETATNRRLGRLGMKCPYLWCRCLVAARLLGVGVSHFADIAALHFSVLGL